MDLWGRWNANDGPALHNSQAAVLLRGMALCKKGGTVVYSTCSMNPIEDEAACRTIHSYDPYANVKAQPYPPLMVTAGLNDPRVTYWEPAKWVARLRATKTDDNILLLKTNMGAGHGGKSGRFESIREAAEEVAFILWQQGSADRSAAEQAK